MKKLEMSDHCFVHCFGGRGNELVCVCVLFFDLQNNCNRIITKVFILNIFTLGKETTVHVHSGILFSPMKEQT